MQGHYSEADARSIFLQIIKAIQYLHSRWAGGVVCSAGPRTCGLLSCAGAGAFRTYCAWGRCVALQPARLTCGGVVVHHHTRTRVTHHLQHRSRPRPSPCTPPPPSQPARLPATWVRGRRGIVHRDLKLENLLLVDKRDITRIKIAGEAVLALGLDAARKVPGGREMAVVLTNHTGWQAAVARLPGLCSHRPAHRALARPPAPQTLGWRGGTAAPAHSPPSAVRRSTSRQKSSRQARRRAAPRPLLGARLAGRLARGALSV